MNPPEDQVEIFRHRDEVDETLIIDHRIEHFDANFRIRQFPLNRTIAIADRNQEQQREQISATITEETYEKQPIKYPLHSTSLIGWMTRNEIAKYITRAAAGLEHTRRTTKHDIFPVLTYGPEDKIVTKDQMETLLTNNYYWGNYLAYVEIDEGLEKKRITSYRFNVVSKDGDKLTKIIKSTIKALRPFSYMPGENHTTVLISDLEISHIYDDNSTVFPYRGIYGGGPPAAIPPTRLTFDQPIDGIVAANFRFDTSYQRFTSRVGYFCTKNALLVDIEHSGKYLKDVQYLYSALLKSHTFAIIDGTNRYIMDISADRFVKRFFTVDIRKEFSVSVRQPVIVMLTEGVNRISVSIDLNNTSWRYCEFTGSDVRQHPIVIDFYTLQSDIEVSDRRSPPVFASVMNVRDIGDFIRWNFEGRQYLFSMACEPMFFDRTIELQEQWYIYKLMDDSDPHNHYYYLVCRMAYLYRRQLRYHIYRFAKSFYHVSPFNNQPLPEQFDTERNREFVVQSYDWWRGDSLKFEYNQFIQIILPHQTLDRYENIGVLAQRRRRLYRDKKVRFFKPKNMIINI